MTSLVLERFAVGSIFFVPRFSFAQIVIGFDKMFFPPSASVKTSRMMAAGETQFTLA
jgi:hypothetical protein